MQKKIDEWDFPKELVNYVLSDYLLPVEEFDCVMKELEGNVKFIVDYLSGCSWQSPNGTFGKTQFDVESYGKYNVQPGFYHPIGYCIVDIKDMGKIRRKFLIA